MDTQGCPAWMGGTCEGSHGGAAPLLRREQHPDAALADAARRLSSAVVRRQPRTRQVGAAQHPQHHLQGAVSSVTTIASCRTPMQLVQPPLFPHWHS